jgi:drug/metabolite transporter (DMT)-like permease
LRFDIAAVVLLAALAVTGRLVRPRRRDLPALLVTATFLVWLNGTLLFVGQQYLPSATAAILFAIVPLATPVFAVVLSGDDRVSPRRVVGLVIGFLGVVVVVAPGALLAAVTGGVGSATVGSGDARSLGHVLILGAALSLAFGSVVVRQVRPGLPLVSRTAYAMALGGVANHLTSLAAGEPALTTLAWTPTTAAAVVYVGVVSTALAFPAYFSLIDTVGAVRANLVAYAVPVVATVAGAVLLDERVAVTTVAGFLIVAIGFAVVEADVLLGDGRRPRRGGSTRTAASPAASAPGSDRSAGDSPRPPRPETHPGGR